MIDRLSLRAKLIALTGFLLTALIVVAAAAFVGEKLKARAAMEADAYSRAGVMHMEGDMMHDAIRGDVLDTLNSSAAGKLSAEETQRLADSIRDHAERFSEIQGELATLALDSATVSMLVNLRRDVNTYLAAGRSAVETASADHAKGQQQFPAFMSQFSALEEAMGAASETLEKKRIDAQARVAETERQIALAQWLVTFLALVVGSWLAVVVLRSVRTTLGGDPREAMAVANAVADSDLTLKITLAGGDQKSLMYALSVMQANLRERVASDQRTNDEMTRIKIALDNVSTGVMIADAERKIIYVNSSVQRILKEAESDLKKVLPSFNADKLVGESIDQFHKNPAHQAGLLSTLSKTYLAELTIGARRMQVIANPVINDKGERLGAVAEWKDRTEELATREREQRIAGENLRVKIALDSVSTPVRIADNTGKVVYANQELLTLLSRIEGKLKAQNPAFSVAGFVGSSIGNLYADPDAALKRLSAITSTVDTVMDIGGRTFRVVTTPVIGADNERLGTVGEWQDRTDQIAVEQEIGDLVSAAVLGDLSQRIGTEGKTGFYASLAEGLNQLVNTTQQALDATSNVLSRVAQGDLTHTVEVELSGIYGQLKDDTNTTIERLREVIGQIKEATDLISTASKEIAAGNTDLSSRTEQQASSLEETASSMEELNSTVKQNAENAVQANALARSSNDTAVKSGQMVQQIVSTMTGIQESSKKIADIIGVIDSIAFQTNILALNAAVEAARAGEQGRGFAVVATEVRNLAQRSATAAKEIKELIAESTGKVDMGTRLVDQAGISMDAVVTSFQQVTALVTDIAHASKEQSSGIEQVTQAVGQMDEVTQQNAALVEEAAAAAESLEEQARALAQAVAMFKLDDRTGCSVPGPALRSAPAPRQLTGKAGIKNTSSAGRTSLPMHLASDAGDEWAEF